jgi:ligand-binding sensor protein
MTTSPSHYIVQTASAKCAAEFGRYRRVAVLEVDADRTHVSMISTHARGCRRIVETWERQHCGTTEHCAYTRACAEAHDLAARLNARKAAGDEI